jgi:hypothetical protein
MTLGDRILITFVSSLIGLLLLNIYLPHTKGSTVLVSIAGEPVRVVEDDELFENKVLTIPIAKGEAEIEISDGRARILPMPAKICPRGICSSFGWIERPGEAAICVPNQLVVEVKSEGQNKIVDSVSR